MKRFYTLIVFLASLILTSCGGPRNLWVEQTFTDKEVTLIADAVDEWMLATDSPDAQIFVDTGFAYQKPFTKEDWDEERDFGVMFKITTKDPGYKDLGGDFLGLANADSGNVIIVSDRIDSDELLYKILLHEVGHLYGLGHAESGIMKQGIFNTEDICIHPEDLDEFCDKHDCGQNARSTCKQ